MHTNHAHKAAQKTTPSKHKKKGPTTDQNPQFHPPPPCDFQAAYFFWPVFPFLPFERRLFLPIAILCSSCLDWRGTYSLNETGGKERVFDSVSLCRRKYNINSCRSLPLPLPLPAARCQPCPPPLGGPAPKNVPHVLANYFEKETEPDARFWHLFWARHTFFARPWIPWTADRATGSTAAAQPAACAGRRRW